MREKERESLRGDKKLILNNLICYQCGDSLSDLNNSFLFFLTFGFSSLTLTLLDVAENHE
jgi:hypothetical protein